MKDLNMSWEDIKKIPRVELDGILLAYQNYSTIHAFDGYNDKDVSEMAKNKPEVRSQYSKSRYLKEIFEHKAGIERKAQAKTFGEILK
tara:strand:- start:1249 stop:1512 length:264 start_codon:yes stop_codon:yes gene_type:complete